MDENQVRALAVSYHALLEASACGNSAAANTWAYILDKAQKATGVMLIKQETVDFWKEWKRAA